MSHLTRKIKKYLNLVFRYIVFQPFIHWEQILSSALVKKVCLQYSLRDCLFPFNRILRLSVYSNLIFTLRFLNALFCHACKHFYIKSLTAAKNILFSCGSNFFLSNYQLVSFTLAFLLVAIFFYGFCCRIYRFKQNIYFNSGGFDVAEYCYNRKLGSHTEFIRNPGTWSATHVWILTDRCFVAWSENPFQIFVKSAGLFSGF